MDLRFPIFLIASADGVTVIITEDGECIMLFHTKELAMTKIEKLAISHPQLSALQALEVPSARSLAEGLQELPADVTCAVWDPTEPAAGFVHVSVDELIRSTIGR